MGKKLFAPAFAACIVLYSSIHAGAALPEPVTERGDVTSVLQPEDHSDMLSELSSQAKLQDALPEPATAKPGEDYEAPQSFGDAAS